jgi:hypothetical protein
VLKPEDDLRHTLAPGPHARESLFYNALLPDEGLMAFFYTWVDAEGRAGHLFTVVGDDNERLAMSATDGVPVGDMDFDDWEVQGLRVRHSDPLRVAELEFEGEGVSCRVTFRGTHDAFTYLDNEDGCPSFIADERFEQSGHLTGTLTLGDRVIEIDTTAHRDHSWGTRDWDSIQDWKWLSAQAGDDDSLNLLLMHGRGKTTRHGYVWRHGVLSAIVEARVDAEYDAHWWQTSGRFLIRDASGHETVVTAERFALFTFDAGENMLLNEAGCRGTIDGKEAIVHFEAGWDRTYSAAQARRVAAAAG